MKVNKKNSNDCLSEEQSKVTNLYLPHWFMFSLVYFTKDSTKLPSNSVNMIFSEACNTVGLYYHRHLPIGPNYYYCDQDNKFKFQKVILFYGKYLLLLLSFAALIMQKNLLRDVILHVSLIPSKNSVVVTRPITADKERFI